MNWETIINNLIGTGAVTAAVIFVGKRVIELWFSKDLEKFKADLQREATEFQIKYQSLHAERAMIIKKIYKLIVVTETKLTSLMHPLQLSTESSQTDKAIEVSKAINVLSSYFEQNRIFLDKMTDEKVAKVIRTCLECWSDYDVSLGFLQQERKDYKRWHEAWKNFTRQVPAAKEEVTKEFRHIAGVKID